MYYNTECAMYIPSLEAKLAENPKSPVFARLAFYYLKEGKPQQALQVCLKGLEFFLLTTAVPWSRAFLRERVNLSEHQSIVLRTKKIRGQTRSMFLQKLTQRSLLKLPLQSIVFLVLHLQSIF